MLFRQSVVIGNPELGFLEPVLSKHYTVLRAWAPADASGFAEARALIVAGDVPLDQHLIARMPSLGLIACASRGYDAIDSDWVHDRGLQFSHAEHVNEEDVADYAVGQIILHRRALIESDRSVRSDTWATDGSIVNRSLQGARLGIVGLGSIGFALAERASALRMVVGWWAPNPKPSPWPRSASLLALARESDYLVVAARAHDNDGLISAEVIEALGAKGFLISLARGRLVDEDALIAALHERRLGGAALDVFEKEPTSASKWRDVPGTMLSPHIAGKTDAAFLRIGDQLRANLCEFFDGRPVLTPVTPARLHALVTA